MKSGASEPQRRRRLSEIPLLNVGTIRGTLGASAKIGPVIDGRFHAAFPQCAQECAHAVVTISLGRIVEPIAFQGVSGKAAVFQTGIIANSPSPEIFAGSASACGSYTYKSAVRWPRGCRVGADEGSAAVVERLAATAPADVALPQPVLARSPLASSVCRGRSAGRPCSRGST